MRTNFEKIKAMNTKELAEFLRSILHCCSGENACPGKCPLIDVTAYTASGIEEWLKSEEKVK